MKKEKFFFEFSFEKEKVTTELEIIFHNNSAYLYVDDYSEFIKKISGNGCLPKEMFGKLFSGKMYDSQAKKPTVTVTFYLTENNVNQNVIYEVRF
ncbi:MAG: hypothetical protein KBB88_02990 [Candidatus Pacebacteria bacterium]|nr:hypothetical protein [Candidatus Paceibacterota bacterium]